MKQLPPDLLEALMADMRSFKALDAFINKQTDENAKKAFMQSKQQIDGLFK